MELPESLLVIIEVAPPVCPKLYRPRKPERSPLYRILQDHLEIFLRRGRRRQPDDPQSPLVAFMENALRAFLECGIPRFGLARFLCKDSTH